jgi:hypothetical protein
MRTRAATIGVAAIGMAAAAAVARAAVPAAAAVARAVVLAAAAAARAAVPAAAEAQAVSAGGVDARVGSMPWAATLICPGAIWPREAKAGC